MTRGLTMYVTLRLANEDRVNHMYIEICVCFLVWVKTWCHVLAGFVAATAAALECVHTYRWTCIRTCWVVARDGGYLSYLVCVWFREMVVSCSVRRLGIVRWKYPSGT